MAVTFTGAGTAQNATSQTSVAVTTATAFAVGDYLVVLMAYDNSGGGGADPMSGTVSVSGGFTGAGVGGQTGLNDPGAASAGLAARCIAFPVTTAIPTSTSITVSWSGNAVAKAVVFMKVSCGTGNTVAYRTNSGSTGVTTGNVNVANAAALVTPSVTNLEGVLCWATEENGIALTGDADTTNGSWGSIYGTFNATTGGVGGMAAYFQGKVVTATATQTFNPTGNATLSDWITGCLIFTETIAPQITQASYRIYDSGTETGSVALAAQDTAANGDITNGDGIGQLRVRLQNTNAVTVPSTDDWQLQWEKNASGTWTNVLPFAIVDSSLITTGGNYIGFNGTTTAAGESFNGNGAPLTRAGFRLQKTGTAPGNITATLYAHTGTFGTTGVPTGAALAASTTTFAASTVGTSYAWYYFNFDGSFVLANGTPYVIVVSVSSVGDASNFINVQAAAAPLPSGNASFFASGAWNSSGDICFEVNSPSSVSPYNDPNLTDGAATTNRLGSGTGTFVAGKISETGLVTDLGWTASNYTELLYPVAIDKTQFVNGDVIRFRVLRNGATTWTTYTQVPTVNVVRGTATIQATIATTFDFTATATATVTSQLSSLTDTFDTALDTAVKWSGGTTGGVVWDATGQAKLPITGPTYPTNYSRLVSENKYNFAGSSLVAKVTHVLGASRETYMKILPNGGTTGIKQMFVVGNTGTNLQCGPVSVTYSAVNHAWWRIRESGGTIYYDTSPDGVVWTNISSESAGAMVLSPVQVQFESGYSGSETAANAFVDNVNVVPAAVVDGAAHATGQAQDATGTNTTITLPSVGTHTAGAMAVSAGGSRSSGTAWTGLHAEYGTADQSTGNGYLSAIAAHKTPPGTTDTARTVTNTGAPNGQWVAASVAVIPATGSILLRGYASAFPATSSTVNVTLPAGSAAGDLAVVISFGDKTFVTLPTNFTQIDFNNSNAAEEIRSSNKMLTAGDITNGYVTLPGDGNFNGVRHCLWVFSNQVSSGDATATPAAITLSVVAPAPTASGTATTTPTTATLTVVTPAPTASSTTTTSPAAIVLSATAPAATASGASNATPAAIARVVSTPAPTVAGAAVATPAAIARTVTTPAPTTTGGTGATTTPAAIVLAATTPAPTARGNGTTTPAAITLTAVTPAPTATGTTNGNAFPTAIALVAVVPAPTVTGTAVTTPAAIARTVSTPAPTVTGTANTTPAAVALAVVVPAPTATGSTNGTAFPTAIALTATTPAPTITGQANATPAAIARTVSTPAPTATGTANGTALPAAIALSAVVYDTTGYPAVVTATSAAGNTASLITALIPSGVQVGDLLLVIVGSTTLVTPAGYTKLFEQAVGTSFTIWGRIATGTSDSFYSNTANQATYLMWRINHHGVVSLTSDIKVSAGATTTTQTFDPPSLDAGSVGAWLWVAAAYYATSAGGLFVNTAPSGYSGVLRGNSGGSGTVSNTIWAWKQLLGQTENPGTMSATTTGASIVGGDAVTLAIAGVSTLSASGGGVASPSAVALSATVPAPTATAGTGASTSPAAIVRNVVTPAPTITGQANVTPAAIALSAVTPAPTAAGTANGTALPAAIVLAAVTAAPTVGGASNATPPAITRTVTTPTPTGTGQAATTPAAIARTVVTPAPTATGGTGASTAPAAIVHAAVTPAPTITGTAVATPAAIALSVVTPTPTATGGFSGTATPTTIALSATVPAPTTTGTGTGTVNPPAITRSVVTPTPVVSGAGNTSPAAIVRAVSVPAPTVTASSNTTPATVARTVSVPAPTITGQARITPSTVALAAAAATPTVTGTGTASPAAITLTVVTPAPTIGVAVSAFPAAITLTAVTPTPTARGSATASPATIALTVVVPAPATGVAASAFPTAIVRTVVVPAPTASGGARAPPAAITLAAAVPTPTVTGQQNASATPPTIGLSVVVPTPTASGGSASTTTPATIALVAVVPAPTVLDSVGGIVIPPTIGLVVTVPAPTANVTYSNVLNDAIALYLGEQTVDRVYAGDVLVWP